MKKEEIRDRLLVMLDDGHGVVYDDGDLNFDASRLQWIDLSEDERTQLIKAIKSSKTSKDTLKTIYNAALGAIKIAVLLT